MIILIIEPQPAGPTFARCALQGAHAGPNGLPMDTNIYTRELRQPTRVTGSYLCKITHALRVSKHVTESIRNIARGVGIN